MKKELPKRLYRYQGLNLNSLRSLVRGEIFFPSPNRFNDPFDCSFTPDFHEVGDEEVPVILDWLARASGVPVEQLQGQVAIEGKEQFLGRINMGAASGFYESIANVRDKRGIACLAESYKHPLMWAHYSDGHRGICLEFDTSLPPFHGAKPVVYQQEKPKLRISEVLTNPIETNPALLAYCTKLPEWKYEAEWRILHSVGDTSELYKAKALTGIFLGAAIEEKNVDLITRMMEQRDPKPRIVRARICREELRLRFDEE